MNDTRDGTTGAIVILCALLAGLGLAMLDMTIDDLPLILALLLALGFLFGFVAPRWSWLAGLAVGIVLPVAQVYVTRFELRLPHPMHGFYFGLLAVAPPVASALVAMWARDWIDAMLEDRRQAAREERERTTVRSPVRSGVRMGVGGDVVAHRDLSARKDQVTTRSRL